MGSRLGCGEGVMITRKTMEQRKRKARIMAIKDAERIIRRYSGLVRCQDDRNRNALVKEIGAEVKKLRQEDD